LCSSSWGQVIHWEVDGAFPIPGTDTVLRTVSGGFDFNTQSSSFSNVALASSTTGSNCLECFDYTGADGELLTGAVSGVTFTKRLDYEFPVYQTNTLSIFEGGGPQEPFDLTRPGVYNTLDLFESLYIYLGEPFNPDIYASDLCFDCASAVGTLVPIPEPETYAMLLAGLGLLGFRMRRKPSPQ
jgi:hypothetical protein